MPIFIHRKPTYYVELENKIVRKNLYVLSFLQEIKIQGIKWWLKMDIQEHPTLYLGFPNVFYLCKTGI